MWVGYDVYLQGFRLNLLRVGRGACHQKFKIQKLLKSSNH